MPCLTSYIIPCLALLLIATKVFITWQVVRAQCQKAGDGASLDDVSLAIAQELTSR